MSVSLLTILAVVATSVALAAAGVATWRTRVRLQRGSFARREAERSLRDQRALLQTIIDEVPAAIAFVDRDERLRLHNRVADESLAGHARAGETLRDALGDAAYAAARPYFMRAMAGERIDFTQSVQAKNGTERQFAINLLPHRGEDGAVDGVVLHALDITERQRGEQQIRASERRFRSLAIAASALVFHADAHGRVRAAPGWTEFTGQAERELVDDGWLDAIHHDDRTRVSDAWARARARNEQVELECRLRTASGAWRFVAIRAVPIHDENGRVAEWIGMVRDVHNRRHAQAMLAAREQEMRLILDHTEARIAYVTVDRRFRWANHAFCQWHGRTPHEVTGASIDEVLNDAEAASFDRRLAGVRGGRAEQFESREQHPSLGERWSLSTITPDLAEDGTLIGCIVLSVDTTVRRQMEEAIRRSEAEHRALTEHVPHLVWIADAAGRVYFCNRRWHHYTGHGTGVDWRAAVHPDDAALVDDAWQVALERGEALDVEARYRRASDGEQRWHMMRAIPILARNGLIERWYGSCTDIEDVKRAQVVLESAAQQTQSFLAMLSHELRNPLTAITMASQLLAEPRAREAQRDTARETIQRQSQLLRRVVDDLLEIARVTHGHIELKRETFELGAAIRLVCRDLEARSSRFGVTLRCEIDADDVYVDADPARLQQMVDNLVSNAVRASEPGSAVEVQVGGDDESAWVTVSDHGRGIEPSLLRSIFDPFVRGESNRIEGDLRPGLGLGLTIVRRLADLHGGEVRAASLGVGHGATFTLEFPRASSPARSAESVVSLAQSVDPGSRVLVIDDERESADALQAVLELHGFDVATAYDGVEGLERYRVHQPEVIVCDLGLSEPLDGYGVAQTIVQGARARGEERPYLIAFSGYGRPEDVQHAHESGFDTHLLKPASATDVLARIEAGLKGRARGEPRSPSRV